MKKLSVLLLVVVLIFAMSVPALASGGGFYGDLTTWKYNGTVFPAETEMPIYSGHENYAYKYLVQIYNGTIYYVIHPTPLHFYTVDLGTTTVLRFTTYETTTDMSEYKYNSSTGSMVCSRYTGAYVNEDITLLWANTDVYSDGVLYMEGSEPVTGDEGITLDAPDWDIDTYPFGFIMDFNDGEDYYFYAYNERGYVDTNGQFGLDGPVVGVKYYYNQTTSSWEYISDLETEDERIVWDSTVTSIYWANYNIYNSDGTSFFQQTPVMKDIVTMTSLGGVLQEILLILPIGLGCWVGYLALRKALATLRQVLLKG